MHENYRRQEQRMGSLDINTLLDYIKDGSYNEKIFSRNGILENAGKNIPQHQLRKFYSEILNIRDTISLYKFSKKDEKETPKLLKIKLAMIEPIAFYTKSRLSKSDYSYQFSEIVEFISKSISTINSDNNFKTWEEKFERFKQLFQSIIAYSKPEKRGE
ncbi:MAG: type III-A CRISPR-associated protein Csm2 [Thermoplasmata archaeon]|jgi:CRISPR type III-A-associated protein Csm2